MQRNWIGKSLGAEIQFQITQINKNLNIFTTRPDTIYGASFIAVSINHPLVKNFLNNQEIDEIKLQFQMFKMTKKNLAYL
jgi:leucyl-tRNA synthetase